MNLELTPFPQVVDDFKRLPTDQHKQRVLELLRNLKTDPNLGQPLSRQRATGDLSDCRKLYFARTTDESPDYRIVYRLKPNESKPRFIEVIIIGPRSENEVYIEAVKRLERR